MAKPIQNQKTATSQAPTVPAEASAPAPAAEAIAAATEAQAPVTTVAKAPKSVSSRLVAPGKADGKNPVEALVLGYSTKGGWIVAITTFTEFYEKGKEREGTRGATAKVNSLAEARKAVADREKALLAAGWTKPETKPLGLERKADSFDLNSLPRPSAKK